MSELKKKPSGATYKRKAKEENLENVTKQTKNIETFFSKLKSDVEESSAYDIISKTYTEREKCGLKEIKAFTLPMVAVPVRKHSGYRDLLGARLRWQREVGLMDRFRRIWMSARPVCDAGRGGFVSVGLVDVLPAAHALLAGVLLAALCLLLERLAHAARRRRVSA